MQRTQSEDGGSIAPPKPSKKHLKFGLAGLAVVALIVGLSVRLTSRNKAGKTASASQASGYDVDSQRDPAKDDAPQCSVYSKFTGGSSKYNSESYRKS